MRYLFTFLALTAIFAAAQAQKSPDISQLEKERFIKTLKGTTSASDNFTVYYNRCNWNIDPSVLYISGSVTSYLRFTKPASELTLDLSSALTVDSVLQQGQRLTFIHSADALTVNFVKQYNKGKEDSITIFYRGVPVGSGFGSFVKSTHRGTPVIWTLSEPFGAKDWWPCRNGLDDKVDSIDIFVKHPKAYKTSSNGMLISETPVGNDIISYYKHRYPVASYLVAIAVTNYAMFTEYVEYGKNKRLPVINYVYPEDSAYFHQNIGFALNGLELFSKAFIPYPFLNEKYGQTQFGWGGGMEHQTNSFITSSNQSLATHELAHQWFGDKVTCKSWEDVWLNEGFATYCADILYNEKYDKRTYNSKVKEMLNSTVSQKGGSVKVTDTTNSNRIFDTRLTYNKGGLLVRMLRFTLGDEAFFRGITNYLNDHKLAYGFATTDDLKRNLEEASGKELGYFFDQWYSGEGYPSFTVEWSQDQFNNVTLTVHQTTSHSSVPFFKVPLPITLRSGNREKTIVLDYNENDQTFVVPAGYPVSDVLIDKDKYLISKKNKVVSKTIRKQPEFTVSPNPFLNQIYVRLNESGKDLNLQLFDNSGQPIASQKYNDFSAGQSYLLKTPDYLAKGLYRLQVITGKNVVKSIILVKE